jgi:hypothetical protein
MSEPYRMSAKLREELERIAGYCNNGESHVAGDALERLLGYEVDEQGKRIEVENEGDEQ